MSDQNNINLLIVDRSLSNIKRITQILNSTGYLVETLHADSADNTENIIQYKPLDLVMVRMDENLPSIVTIRTQITKSSEDIPLVAIMDAKTTQKPVDALRAGAEDLFYLNEPEHLVLMVGKVLRHSHLRHQISSYETRLKEMEVRNRTLLESSRDPIAYIHEGTHMYANPAYLQMFGYNDEKELTSATLIEMVIREDRDKLKRFLRQSTKKGQSKELVELTGLHRNGSSTFPIKMNCILTRVDEEPCLQIQIQTAAEQQVLHNDQQNLSQLDSFTGLYNRKFLANHLNELCANTPIGALLYILLTDYRAINERLGLEAINQLILDLVKLFKGLVSKNDIITRFSDAIFIIYTPEPSEQKALEFSELITETLKEHTSHAAESIINTQCAIGICLIAKRHKNASQLVKEADQACEAARQLGQNQVQIYNPPKTAKGQAVDETQLLRIREAISAERLSLRFQPIASFQDSTAQRYKTYLHMLDDKQQPLPLSMMGTVAEQHGLMYALDKWVISQSLDILGKQDRKKAPCLFIRLSSNSVMAQDFFAWLEQLFKDTGLKGNTLVFEITEECAAQYLKECKTLRMRLKNLGCGFALSDFGDKTSSPRILRYLIPDYIKFDISLIEKLSKTRRESDRELVTQLTQQAQEMNISMVASNIANATQMASIWPFGITLMQGNMLQEPTSEMDFDFQQFAG